MSNIELIVSMSDSISSVHPPTPSDHRQVWRTYLSIQPVIAVIRPPDFQRGYAMAQAVSRAGMKLIEIARNDSSNTDCQLQLKLIYQLRQSLPNCYIGAGSILNQRTLQQVIVAGSQFCFMPHSQCDLIQIGQSLGVPIIPGALTPTEITHAWQWGASSVKVFPISAVGGVSYIRQLREPLHPIPLIPSGGVTLENAMDFLQAGAVGVGLSSALFPTAAIADGNWREISQRASTLLRSLH